jgi:hypothetical protein
MTSEHLQLQGCSLQTATGLERDGWLLRTNRLNVELVHDKHLLNLDFFLPDDDSVVYEGGMELHVEATYPIDGRISYIQPIVPGFNALQIRSPAAISCRQSEIPITPAYRIASNNVGDQRDLAFKLTRINAG